MAKKHSDKYETVKKYYTMGMWDEQRVRNAVAKGWITEDEFEEITGKPF